MMFPNVHDVLHLIHVQAVVDLLHRLARLPHDLQVRIVDVRRLDGHHVLLHRRDLRLQLLQVVLVHLLLPQRPPGRRLVRVHVLPRQPVRLLDLVSPGGSPASAACPAAAGDPRIASFGVGFFFAEEEDEGEDVEEPPPNQLLHMLDVAPQNQCLMGKFLGGGSGVHG